VKGLQAGQGAREKRRGAIHCRKEYITGTTDETETNGIGGRVKQTK
jgi:hypothetical protein